MGSQRGQLTSQRHTALNGQNRAKISSETLCSQGEAPQRPHSSPVSGPSECRWLSCTAEQALKGEIPSTLGPTGDTAPQRWSQSWGHVVPKGHGDRSQWQRPSGRGQAGSEMCLGCGEVEEEGLSSLGAPQNQILGADGWRGRQRSSRRKAGPQGLLCGAGMPWTQLLWVTQGQLITGFLGTPVSPTF